MGLFGKKKIEVASNNNRHITLENGETVNISSVVDCIGDSCPRPQLMTKSALSKGSSGDIFEVQVDNSTSMEALPDVVAENGGECLGTVRQDRSWSVVVRKL